MKQAFGTHELEIDGDVARMTFHGPVSLADSQQLASILGPMSLEFGYLLCVVDARDSGPVSAESRRYVGAWLGARLNAAIFIGAGVIQRAMVTMITRLIVIFGGENQEITFVKSEAEADALIPIVRASLRARVPSPKMSVQ